MEETPYLQQKVKKAEWGAGIGRSEVNMPKSIENHNGFTEEEERLWRETVHTGEDMGRMFNMRDERRRREREEELKEQWPSTEAARLFTQLAETFTACQKLLEQSPATEAAAKLADGERHDVFTMLRDNLEKANRAPRCEYQKSNGQLCRAPKVRGQKYCCMHLAMEAARPTKFSLPALDDANAIQVAITKGAQGLVDGTLEEKRATRLAYFLQLAMSNVGKVNFEPEEDGQIG
jgi:predicted ATP-dependent endonuclease of OLD family